MSPLCVFEVEANFTDRKLPRRNTRRLGANKNRRHPFGNGFGKDSVVFGFKAICPDLQSSWDTTLHSAGFAGIVVKEEQTQGTTSLGVRMQALPDLRLRTAVLSRMKRSASMRRFLGVRSLPLPRGGGALLTGLPRFPLTTSPPTISKT